LKSLKTKLFIVISDKVTTDSQKWALVSSTTEEFLLAPSSNYRSKKKNAKPFLLGRLSF